MAAEVTPEAKERGDSRIPLDRKRIAAFCRRWKIVDLRAFGSVLRNDFRADSDIDLLVTFGADADWGLLGHVAMTDELGRIVGRKVDLITRGAIERSQNWIRRRRILETAKPIYVAR